MKIQWAFFVVVLQYHQHESQHIIYSLKILKYHFRIVCQGSLNSSSCFLQGLYAEKYILIK